MIKSETFLIFDWQYFNFVVIFACSDNRLLNKVGVSTSIIQLDAYGAFEASEFILHPREKGK